SGTHSEAIAGDGDVVLADAGGGRCACTGISNAYSVGIYESDHRAGEGSECRTVNFGLAAVWRHGYKRLVDLVGDDGRRIFVVAAGIVESPGVGAVGGSVGVRGVAQVEVGNKAHSA